MYRFSTRYPIRSQVKLLKKTVRFPATNFFLNQHSSAINGMPEQLLDWTSCNPLRNRQIPAVLLLQPVSNLARLSSNCFQILSRFESFHINGVGGGMWLIFWNISCASMAQRISSSSTQTGRTKRPPFKSRASEVPHLIVSQGSAT